MTGLTALYISIPVVSALIGWLTNYIAVKMIFRPRHPRHIAGIIFHGLIPRRQHELGHTLGELVERELVSHQDIQKVIASPEVTAAANQLVEQQVDKFINEKLGTHPLLAMVVPGDLVKIVKGLLVRHFQAAIPDFLDSCMIHIENHLDFKAIVQAKIENFDYVKLEEIVYQVASKELKTIERLGAVLGFIVGLIQVLLIHLLA